MCGDKDELPLWFAHPEAVPGIFYVKLPFSKPEGFQENCNELVTLVDMFFFGKTVKSESPKMPSGILKTDNRDVTGNSEDVRKQR